MSILNTAKIINSEESDDNFDSPIDISDILNVCKEYSKLGWQIQNQIECLNEFGIEECVNSGKVNVSALPFIKNFLKTIADNPLFGDASEQSIECVSLIENYEATHPQLIKKKN